MFTDQVSQLSRLVDELGPEAVDILANLFGQCRQNLRHNGRVQLHMDPEAARKVPNKSGTDNPVFAPLDVSNPVSYVDDSLVLIGGCAAFFQGPLFLLANNVNNVVNNHIVIFAKEGGICIQDIYLSGYLQMDEITKPTTPGSNKGQIYFKDNGGTTTPYMQDSAGTETSLLAGGSAAIGWNKYSLAHDDTWFDVGATTAETTLITLAAKQFITDAFIKPTTVMTHGTAAICDVSLGIATDNFSLVAGLNLMTGIADATYGRDAGPDTHPLNTGDNWTGTSEVKCYAQGNGGDNLNTYDGGEWEAHIKVEQLS